MDCGTARGISVSPRNGMMPKRVFGQTLIGRSPNHGDLVKLGEAVFDKNNVWVDIKAFVVKYYTRQDKRVLEYQNRSLKREVKYLREIIASKGLSLNSSETPSSDPKETPSSDPNKETLSSDPSQDQSQSSPTL
ncbi:hypothetical protein T459_14559 [Capsicum annuum]|uniref:Uncharacterized protein n=1 Tax=Capsicum annuum TaxID=4072 RepID=A0A2G2ZHX8_CAPAN|nr:hypothetical protein T459_14559 [Capsicum annuum]